MSNFTKTLICNIHQLAQDTNDEKTKQQLLNLWRNVCNHKRAQEAISCSSIHTKETITESRKELSKLSSADDLISKIILQ